MNCHRCQSSYSIDVNGDFLHCDSCLLETAHIQPEGTSIKTMMYRMGHFLHDYNRVKMLTFMLDKAMHTFFGVCIGD